MDIEDLIEAIMQSVSDQRIYNDRDFARMTAYLWKLDDREFVKELGFGRPIDPSREYLSMGVRTRVELRRSRHYEGYYKKAIQTLMKKLKEQDKNTGESNELPGN